MTVSRRDILKTAAALPAVTATLSGAHNIAQAASPLPDKSSFGEMSVTYINSSSQHPLLLSASRAVETYLSKRRLEPGAPGGRHDSNEPLINFAKIINADVSEVAYVQSTTAGEQMIVRGLGFPESGGHIITDEFHFPGSKAIYDGLAMRGVDVTRVKARDGRIMPEDIKAAMRPDTKFIALSLIAMESGFEHDLKAVCDIAHAGGAYVYADIIQGAGAMPIDVKATGLDFAACASYKWLMGDFGTGFVFAKKSALANLKRTSYGSFGTSGAGETKDMDADGFPINASGYFALGTRSFTGVAILTESLKYILDLGVDNIHAHSRMMTDYLKEELPKIGYPLRTPKDSHGPMVVAWKDNAREILSPIMAQEKIAISAYGDRIRISPSVFNDMADIDKLLNALKRGN